MQYPASFTYIYESYSHCLTSPDLVFPSFFSVLSPPPSTTLAPVLDPILAPVLALVLAPVLAPVPAP